MPPSSAPAQRRHTTHPRAVGAHLRAMARLRTMHTRFRAMCWRSGPRRSEMMRRAVVRSGMMSRRKTRRHTHAVYMAGVMPMPAIPRRRRPIRHQAGSRQRRYRENGHACIGIPIHRLPIIVSVNRKAIHIIPRIGPRHSGTPTVVSHTHRTTGVHGVSMHRARAQQHGRTRQRRYVFQ